MGIISQIGHIIADSFNWARYQEEMSGMPFCTNCGLEKYNATKFCRNCGERGIDERTHSALKIEADQVKLKRGGNDAVSESISTLDAIEHFRKQADAAARRKNQQS